jgi:hypothetical protein
MNLYTMFNLHDYGVDVKLFEIELLTFCINPFPKPYQKEVKCIDDLIDLTDSDTVISEEDFFRHERRRRRSKNKHRKEQNRN